MTDSSGKSALPTVGFSGSEVGSTFYREPNGAVRGREPNSVQHFADALGRSLRGRPEAQVVIEDDSVTVLRLTPDGPDVTAIISEGRCTLAIGAWHDDLYSLDVTLNYMKMAVEGSLRVRVDRMNGKPWKYALERRYDDGSWKEESVLELPRFSLWGRRRISTTYLHNRPSPITC